MRIWIALIVAGIIISTHAERQEMKAEMQAESSCFTSAKTRSEVDDCYVTMRDNIARRDSE